MIDKIREYQVIYDPRRQKMFRNHQELFLFLQGMFGIGQGADKEKVRKKMFFLRQADGTLQYFVSVVEGRQLYNELLEVLNKTNLNGIWADQADFTVPSGMTAYDAFSEVIENILPSIWRSNCPVIWQEDMFLNNTLAVVMTVTDSNNGITVCHIDRIYKH